MTLCVSHFAMKSSMNNFRELKRLLIKVLNRPLGLQRASLTTCIAVGNRLGIFSLESFGRGGGGGSPWPKKNKKV